MHLLRALPSLTRLSAPFLHPALCPLDWAGAVRPDQASPALPGVQGGRSAAPKQLLLARYGLLHALSCRIQALQPQRF